MRPQIWHPPIEPSPQEWTLVNFRNRLIERDLDRRLIERTVEVAKERGGFSNRRLCVPRWIPLLCGEQEGWRTRLTSWETLCGRHWA